MLLHADTFTRRHFYIQTLLHTDAFTHRHVYTQKLLTQRFYTAETLSHTDAFYTDAFTHRRFYAQMLLHDAFAHRPFCTQTLLTHRSFCTLSHTNAFTHRRKRGLLLHGATLGTLVLRFRSTRSDRGTALSAQCAAGLPGIEPGPGDGGVALIH